MISLRSIITQKVLDYFLLQERAPIYVNELARVLDIESGNLTRKLLEIEKEGLLSSQWQGKQRYYSLNREFPLIKEYKSIIIKKMGLEQLLKSACLSIEGIEKVLIFGSYAQDKMDAHSDIDLLVIGKQETLALNKVIAQVQRLIHREINVVSMSAKEFESQKNKDPFLKSIQTNKVIRLV